MKTISESNLTSGTDRMNMVAESKLTSGEVGILWMTYMLKSLFSQMAGVFAKNTVNQYAKTIQNDYVTKNNTLLSEIQKIFTDEKAVCPVAFTSADVFSDAPSLFDDEFHMMFLRKIAQIMLGFNAVHLSMSYRKDVRELYIKAYELSKDIYDTATDFLAQQGVLSKPPYITMPKEVEFVEQKNYMSGILMGGNKRALNTIEVSYLYSILEANVFGMQLTTGFAQVAKEKDVRDYFVKGKDLAKKIVTDMSKILMDSDIQPPTTWAGKATDSVIPPFSDKMMMYLSNILSSSSSAGSSLGMAFSMRSDLPLKIALMGKDILDYAEDGGKLMIEHKWLEEPPQMEDRNHLIKSKQ